jgi:hypothetical protein
VSTTQLSRALMVIAGIGLACLIAGGIFNAAQTAAVAMHRSAQP